MTITERIAGTKCEGCGLSKMSGYPFCADCIGLLVCSAGDADGAIIYSRWLAAIRQARINRGATNSRAAKRNAAERK